MNNKGVTYIFIMFVMSVILIFTLSITSLGLVEIKLSSEANDRSKAYYMAEAGIYYARGVIRQNPGQPLLVPAAITVPADESDIGPYYDAVTPSNGYTKLHGFALTITYDGGSTIYTVESKGQYNEREVLVQAEIPADGSAINDLQKITDRDLQ